MRKTSSRPSGSVPPAPLTFPRVRRSQDGWPDERPRRVLRAVASQPPVVSEAVAAVPPIAGGAVFTALPSTLQGLARCF